MRGILIFFISLYSIPLAWNESINPKTNNKLKSPRPITNEFGIPYERFNISVLPELAGENSLQFETELKKLVVQSKEVPAVIAEVALESTSAVLGEIFGPLSAVVPIVKALAGLAEEEDEKVFDALKSVYGQTKVDRAKDLVGDISNNIKRFNTNLEILEEMIKDTNKKVTKQNLKEMIAVSSMTTIQNELEESVTQISDGDSLLWEHPDLAAAPLLLLSTFISTFSRIRDLFFANVIDNSIISCIMEENINAYLPSILYWRLRQVVSSNDGAKVHDEIIYDIAYNTPEFFHDTYEWSRQNAAIRCNQDCKQSDESKALIVKDKLQKGLALCLREADFVEYVREVNSIYDKMASNPDGSFVNDFLKKYPPLEFGIYDPCLIDYLFMVRRKTENLFNTAKDLMTKTCSAKYRNRNRTPTGKGWFSFKKLRYDTYVSDQLSLHPCDIDPENYDYEPGNCDVKIKMFMNDEAEPRYESPQYSNLAKNEITVDFRSPQIRKASVFRFEMYDGNNHFYIGDKLILNETVKVDQLKNNPEKLRFCAGGRDGIHQNCLEIWRPRWQDDYTTF